MNIDGLGDEIIEDFYNMGYIKDISDFYELYKYHDELMELEGFGEKSISNLIEGINNSKHNSLERLLCALGIKNVGKRTAKMLAKKYKTLDNKDIGEIIAVSIRDYFDDPKNIEVINKLKEHGINMEYLGNDSEKANFTDKTFVITGTLSMGRDEFRNKIESLGGKVSESVSKKTDYLVLGENPGSKYTKARELGIKIINEEELNEMFNA